MSDKDSIKAKTKHPGRTGRPRKPRVTLFCKKCIICKKLKPIGDYHKTKGPADGHRGACKDCWNAQRYRWIKANREHVLQKKREDYAKHRGKYLAYMRSDARKAKWFAWKLNHNFGITVEQFEEMMDKQLGCCAICGKAPSELNGHRHKHRLHVDHDHKTGKVRGLLCNLCNVGIGSFRDDTSSMLRAIQYLEDSSPER